MIKKRLWTFLLSVIFMLSIAVITGNSIVVEAAGTTPTPITSLDQISTDVAAGIYNGNYKITTTSFDLADTWVPIEGFAGTLDGGGCIINIPNNVSATGNSGIFGSTAAGAVIKNLGVTGTISGTGDAGLLIGQATGTTISNCYSDGTVTGAGNVGGLVGSAVDSELTDCYTLKAGSGGTYNGGLIGTSDSDTNVTNCYSTADTFIGYSNSTNENCYCTGSVTDAAQKALSDMQSANFAALLNADNTFESFGFIYGTATTPLLIGVGAGKTAKVPCKVTIDTVDNGYIKLLNGTTQVAASGSDYVINGTTLRYTAYPVSLYELSSITKTVNATTTALGSTFVVNADVVITPKFEALETYTIKVEKNAGGTVSPSGAEVLVEKGDTKTFTIIPDDDCKIKSVTYTGSSLTVDDDDDDEYTTGKVTRDETLTVVFTSKAEGVSSVISTSDGIIVTVKTLDDVIDLIDDNEGNSIKVPMDDSTVLDDDTLDALEDKDVNLILDMDDYTWEINGETITSSSSSINLGVDIGGKNAIDSKYLTQFQKYADKTQLDLTYSGAFPFTGYLTFEAPGDNEPGRYANLFYFNETTNKFEKSGVCKIDEDGNATFKFRHASRYMVVVSDTAISLEDLALGADVTDNIKPIVAIDHSQLMFAGILLIAVAAGGILISVIIRKNS